MVPFCYLLALGSESLSEVETWLNEKSPETFVYDFTQAWKRIRLHKRDINYYCDQCIFWMKEYQRGEIMQLRACLLWHWSFTLNQSLPRISESILRTNFLLGTFSRQWQDKGEKRDFIDCCKDSSEWGKNDRREEKCRFYVPMNLYTVYTNKTWGQPI